MNGEQRKKNASFFFFSHLNLPFYSQHLDLAVDFAASTVRGVVSMSLRAVWPITSGDDALELWLDTKALVVEGAELRPGGEGATASPPPISRADAGSDAAAEAAARGGRSANGSPVWGGAGAVPLKSALAPAHPVLGARLVVSIPASAFRPSSTATPPTIAIKYATTPAGAALQWLTPPQTAGGLAPFLFSQCQAIHARSFLPCQDAPAAKFTYTAAVTVPAGLTALMSALRVEEGSEAGSPFPTPPGTATALFRQPVPISSYLLALAVGRLGSARLGPRSSVWAEPEVLPAATAEFGEIEDFISAGERLAGPYVWGVADLLVMPPSFPYGGMENPCCTFVTPTLLAGDRSLVNVVAHEIAHSWAGNGVTAATWEHFWLNEGFTVLLERKIVGATRGAATADLAAASGAAALRSTVRGFGADHPFTALVPDLSGGLDPDDAFSKVPYEKGFALLTHLEGLVGGASVFEPWVKDGWIGAWTGRAASSDDFVASFTAAFGPGGSAGPSAAVAAAVAAFQWEAWLRAPGLPPTTGPGARPPTALGDAADALAARWAETAASSGSPPPGASPADIAGWPADQVAYFLDALADQAGGQGLPPAAAGALGSAYALSSAQNAELRCGYLVLALAGAGAAGVAPVAADVANAAAFLKQQGRMKFVRPLLRALAAADGGAAADALAAAVGGYHPITAKMAAADLEAAARMAAAVETA